MRPDLEAAFRLAQQLKVHTHRQSERRDARGENMRENHWQTARKRRIAAEAGGRKAGGHNRLGLEIDGKRYPSFKVAMQELHIGNVKLSDWISSGKAKIL